MPAAARSLLQAQIAFFSFLLVCVAIEQGGLSDNHGLSFYGGRWSTFVPYALGFASCAVLITRAAILLDAEGDELNARLATYLRILVILLLTIPLTPDTVNQVFYDAHIVASVALFLFEAAFGLWLVKGVATNRSTIALYVVQIFGGVVAGLSQLQWIGLLSEGILVFQLAFGILLVSVTAEELVTELAEA